MIALTRLNGQTFVINADKIRYVEATPDTVICCDHGEKMMVKESLHESDANAGMDRLDFGYSQSKWVSEQVVRNATPGRRLLMFSSSLS